jgi:UDP:flavonoid glycosyltransferase YjiC (YdhE family)
MPLLRKQIFVTAASFALIVYPLLNFESRMMKHLVFCWEFGEGYGHVAGFRKIAQELKKNGIKVTWILRHLDFAHLVQEEQDDVFQAPHTRSTNANKESTLSYSHMLSFLGYSNRQLLLNLVTTWRQLLSMIDADMIVADHAPTALIAAKTLNIKSAMIGTGFFSPPRMDVFPQFCVFPDQPIEKLKQFDQIFIDTINHSLSHFNLAPIKSATDIFSVEEDFLCTFAELDHYPNRPNAQYWGARFSNEMGKQVSYSTDKFRIFVYMHERSQQFTNVMEWLNTSDAEVIVHIPKIDVLKASLSYPNITFYPEPANMESVLQQVDLVICNGGHGTVAATLLAGVKVLMLPIQLEQMMLSQLLTKRGFGAFLSADEPKERVNKMLEYLQKESDITNNVKRFRDYYAGYTSELQSDEIVSRCLEILNDS